MIVAIDGPAGSGKSSIAKLLANELGYYFLNTGSFYRAITRSIWEKIHWTGNLCLKQQRI